jgi:hypothetical protein
VGGLDRRAQEDRVSAAFLLLQEPAAAGVQESLRLLDLPPSWVVVLVILPVLAGLAWVGYAKESLSRPLRALLVGLRLAAFLLLFLVLSRPVLVQRREEVHEPEVLVLLDDSASMRRRDAYSGDEAARRAVERATATSPAETTRLDLARRALERNVLPLLRENGYETRLYSFSESAQPLASLEAAKGRGAGTHVGSSVGQVLAAGRGRHVTDVLVLSDGRSNGGLPVLEAARAAGAAGIPVHTVVIGDTRPERNAVVELVEAPSDALEGDELAVTVRVLGRGVADVASVHVVLEELDEDGIGPRLLAEEEAALGEGGERVVLIAPQRDGLRTGERRFRVSVPPLEGETMTDDNKVEFSVHVSPATIRVLYVDGYPRWEYRYLKNLLLRADQKLEVQCFLLSATPDFPQESTRGLPALREVPTTRAELLERYDVVVLGDVNPYAISPDPSRCEAFLSGVREFVEAGGGLLFQAGEFDNPRAFLQTPLEDVLPIVLDPTGVLSFQGDTAQEFRPLIEDPKSPHEILRLHADPEINRRLWEDPDGLRGFYWYSPIRRAKPGTQVLLRHPSDRNAQGELEPLLVVGYFPSGRTMYVGVDSTWMWRYHYGDRYHELFWRNAIRWLALGRLKSGDRRYRVETNRSTYDLEDRIVLEARILDEDFRPSERPSQEVRWSGPDGREEELELQLAPDRHGVYRGAVQVDRPGLYRVWIEQGGQRVSSTEFEVVLPSRENDDPSPDPETLRLLASLTGGKAVDLGHVAELAAELPGGEERREPISSRLEDAWDHWRTLLLALGLLSAEWILRKRAELI